MNTWFKKCFVEKLFKLIKPLLSMKSLKPSAREKKRYLLIGKGAEDVEKAILSFSGTLGLAKANVRVRFVKKNVISVNRESLDLVRASFAVWPKTIKVEKVSGTLKGLKGKKK